MTRLTPEQARAILEAQGVFTATAPFDGRLIGSIPLDLHGVGADADVVCSAYDLDAFAEAMAAAFGDRTGFAAHVGSYLGRPSAIVRFVLPGLPVEVFARPEPLEAHESFRHFRAASRLLAVGGEPLRAQVRALKALGMKTEPAFAHALGLEGDPAMAMLDLADAPDFVLAALVSSWEG